MGRARIAILAVCWAVSVGTAFVPALVTAGAPRVFADSAGRRVEVPERIERVFAAGPPATVLVYALAPDKLLGWYRPRTLAERGYLPARYADLPTLGKLTGRSNTPNIEVVRGARPDVILDYGTVTPAAVALADRIQKETGVPYVLIDGGLPGIPRACQMAGELLGVPERAGALARYAAGVLAEVDRRVARVPAERRPSAYYARGPRGLESELIESLDALGARNVAAGAIERGALAPVTLEQVLAWDPDVIIAIDATFIAAVRSDPAWQRVKAVRDGRVHLAPLVPFPWVDLPPSVNRLIGVRWLGRVLYPTLFPEDLRREARTFYALFYDHAPDGPQLDALLGDLDRARP